VLIRVGLLLCALIPQTAPQGGVVIDARDRSPVAGAEVIVIGQRGSSRTDAAGRFQWAILPRPPITVVVILPDGRVGRPIRLTASEVSRNVSLTVEAGVAETVTVTGAAPAVDVTPATSVTLLTSADIALRHPATLSQALEIVPGAGFISEGQGAVPSVRGLARGRTTVLVDGSRASAERRAGPNASFIDPATIDRIEVARGPASVAYGSDGFGGVIAVRTRRPDHTSGVRARVDGALGGGVPQAAGNVEVSAGYGAGGVLVGVAARDFDDYHSPSGIVPYSGWHDRGIRVIWEHDTAGGVWSAGWHSGTSRDIGRPRSDSDAIIATSPFETSRRFTASYTRRALGAFRNIRFDGLAGSTSQRSEQDRLPSPGRPRSLDRSDVSSRDVQMRATAERAVGPARLQIGADVDGRYALESIDTTWSFNLAGAVTSTQTSLSIESARRTGVGLFAQADARVAERVQVSGGLRVDSVRSANRGGFFGSRHVENTALAGFVGATLIPGGAWKATVQVARGFRDPMLSDRFYRGPVGRGFIEGNPDLRPETSFQSDITVQYDARRWRFSSAFYDYAITDLIERYAAGSTSFRYRNRGKARLRGAEVEARFELWAGLGLDAAAQVSRGRDAADGTPVDDISPRSVSFVLRRPLGVRGSSYVRVAAVGSHEAAGPSEVPTPGYTLVDAGAAWRISTNIELRGAARNLFNASYFSSAGPRWVYAPGRQGIITAGLKF
jgi:hemoglobin/transferrin/lactoferrin receptor protein